MSQFAEDTAVRQLADKLWRGDLQPGWRNGVVPHGGYVLAVAGQALRAALPHRDPLAVNAFFLAPTHPGPIDCQLETLRAGRNTTHAEAKLFQDGELKVQVTAAFTDLDALEGADWFADEKPSVPAWEDCEPIARWSKVEYFRERVDIRLAQGAGLYTRREPDGSGEMNGWVALRDGTEPDVISLLMFADALPPPIFTVFGLQRWVPTLELTVQVRARPSPGPLQARFRSRNLTRGILEEDGELWDSSGRLVAVSRQTGKLRLQAPAAQ